MSAPVPVCPTCGERDEFPEYWTPKCEQDWITRNPYGDKLRPEGEGA